MEKNWTPISTNKEQVQQLVEALQINPLLCELLVQRGVYTYEQAKEFFRPSLEHLHDPFLMKDMDKAVSRILMALEKEQNVLLYGDYDVDGTTCVALIHTFLERIGCKHLDYYIPDRYSEGYGISKKGIEYAHQNNIDVMIAMDCGIQAIEKVDLAHQLGIDVIVCDHHLPSETLPNAIAVLDPKRKDCPYPYKELSGCGVVFKLVQGLAQRGDFLPNTWDDLFDLLVISIGCDIVEMKGENRTLAFFGLSQINEGEASLGIKALIEKSGKELPISIGDLVFGSGPMINAAGRLADAKEAVRLLLSHDPSEATELAISLASKNQERRDYERSITQEAIDLLERSGFTPDWKTIVLSSPNWHKGVLGIAASKLVEKYHRPTIILSKKDGLLVGSARSIHGFDLHQALCECSEWLSNFGGHKHAAGLSLEPQHLSSFQQQFEQLAKDWIPKEVLVPEIPIAAHLDFDDITPSFLKILKQFAPFGPGNRRPVFRSSQVKDTGASRLVKEHHLKANLKQANSQTFDGIGFWMGHHFDTIIQKPIDICYVIEENRWRGKTSISLNIRDIKS